MNTAPQPIHKRTFFKILVLGAIFAIAYYAYEKYQYDKAMHVYQKSALIQAYFTTEFQSDEPLDGINITEGGVVLSKARQQTIIFPNIAEVEEYAVDQFDLPLTMFDDLDRRLSPHELWKYLSAVRSEIENEFFTEKEKGNV